MRTPFLTFLTMLGLAAIPAMAAPLVFNASGQFSNGGSLSGTVTIDTATGQLLATDLLATVYQTFTFSNNIGGIANYAGSGLYVLIGNATPGGYPIALVGVPETSLEDYQGGPISPASNIIFQNGDEFGISSASFQLLSQTPGPNPVGSFGVTGFAGGKPLSGGVQIDLTTGELLGSTLTALLPRSYQLSANIGGIPNYAGSGFFVIVANEAAGGYPIGLFGLNETNLIGYDGGPIVSASTLNLADGTQFTLTGGMLTATPEPSTLACFLLGGGLMMAARWRKRA